MECCRVFTGNLIHHVNVRPALQICSPSPARFFFSLTGCDNTVTQYTAVLRGNTMDYEFRRDITGTVKVGMSMDHEAVGHWFNEEVNGNLSLLDDVERAAKNVKGSERQWQYTGHEYTLWLGEEEVIIRANQLSFSGDELEEGMRYTMKRASRCAAWRIFSRSFMHTGSLCWGNNPVTGLACLH